MCSNPFVLHSVFASSPHTTSIGFAHCQQACGSYVNVELASHTLQGLSCERVSRDGGTKSIHTRIAPSLLMVSFEMIVFS